MPFFGILDDWMEYVIRIYCAGVTATHACELHFNHSSKSNKVSNALDAIVLGRCAGHHAGVEPCLARAFPQPGSGQSRRLL